VLERHDIYCRIIRIENLLQTPKRIRKFDHLALSAMTMDLPVSGQLVKKWRHERPRGRIIVGGPLSSDPRGVLSLLKPDVLVVGEGESTLEELLKSNFLDDNPPLSEILGVAFLRNNESQINSCRPLISESTWSNDYTPSSTRIVDYNDYQAARVYVEVLRGCSNFGRTTLPLSDGRECTDCDNCRSNDMELRMDCPEDIPPGCGFCSVPNTWGPPRSRSAESIKDEIHQLVDLGVHRIVLEAPDFLDYSRGIGTTNPCNPSTNLEAIGALLDGLNDIKEIRTGDVHLAIENMKACLFTDEVAALLSGSLPSISPNIGLETGSDEHMVKIGKCGNAADVLRAVRVAKKYQMTPFVYFIYGLPGETPDSIRSSVRLMQEVSEAGAERIILYGFRSLPGSAFAGFPEPRSDDPVSKPLRLEATRINRSKKARYVGMVVKGVAAEPSWSRHGYTMVYPLTEGPLMTIKGGYSAGTVLELQVTKVLSAGLLEAEVVK
jgi:radical SAM superfamily enzyme YgiQ (UPF0313 family)